MSRLITLKNVHDDMNQKSPRFPASVLRIKVFKGKYLFDVYPSLNTSSRRHMVHTFSKLDVVLGSLDVIEPNH